jgi:hypothetical protein
VAVFPEDLDVRVLAPRRQRTRRQLLLPAADLPTPDLLLEREHEPSADRLDDCRGSALLTRDRVRVVGVAIGTDEQDGAASGDRRQAIAQHVAFDDEHAGGPRTADELVRGEEQSVLARHVDRQVRARRRVVEAGESAVLPEHARDALDVRDDPGHVRCGREAADLQRPVGVTSQLPREVVDVEAPVGSLADRDDVGGRLAPGQLVGVVLVGADEHDRALAAVEFERTDDGTRTAARRPAPCAASASPSSATRSRSASRCRCSSGSGGR